MKTCKSILCIVGFVLAFMAGATAAEAPPLTFKFTAINVPGAMQTAPSGVNNLGVTVGVYQDQNFEWHGYILDGKRVTKLDHPRGASTTPYNLNPNGAIAVVGSYLNIDGVVVGFLYKHGKFTDIPGPIGGTDTFPSGINDNGAIVGTYRDSAGVPHGFLLKGTTYTTLDVPGSSATTAEDINDKGSIVLTWTDSKEASESSLYDGRTYTTIDVPGATNSYASSLDAVGEVAYDWIGSSGFQHGALLHRGKYYKFEHPKGLQTYAAGINDRHVIVGGYQTQKGFYQGFKATYK